MHVTEWLALIGLEDSRKENRNVNNSEFLKVANDIKSGNSKSAKPEENYNQTQCGWIIPP